MGLLPPAIEALPARDKAVLLAADVLFDALGELPPADRLRVLALVAKRVCRRNFRKQATRRVLELLLRRGKTDSRRLLRRGDSGPFFFGLNVDFEALSEQLDLLDTECGFAERHKDNGRRVALLEGIQGILEAVSDQFEDTYGYESEIDARIRRCGEAICAAN